MSKKYIIADITIISVFILGFTFIVTNLELVKSIFIDIYGG